MSSSDDEFYAEETFDGAIPVQCSALRKGGFMMLNKCPCRILDYSVSKTGKHGRGKIRFTAVDVFDGSKHEGFFPSTHMVPVPQVDRTEFQLVNLSADGFLSVLTERLEIRSDIRLPNGKLGEEIRERFDAEEDLSVSLLECMGRHVVISVKSE